MIKSFIVSLDPQEHDAEGEAGCWPPISTHMSYNSLQEGSLVTFRRLIITWGLAQFKSSSAEPRGVKV